MDALNRVGAAAKNAGLSMEETIGSITVLREASGRTGREVGTALNTIFSYMTRQKTVNLMEALGIRVFEDEAKTTFRSTMELMDEMASKWQGMAESDPLMQMLETDMLESFNDEMAEAIGLQEEWTDIQQRDLAQAAAGVRRRNFFISLMQRFSEVQGVVNTQLGAEGYSLRENERTMATLEKQVEVLKASAQQLAVALGDTGLLREITGLVSGVSSAVRWFSELDESTQIVLMTFIELTTAAKLLTMVVKSLGMAGMGSIMSGWVVPITATTAASRSLMTVLTGVGTVLSNIGKGALALMGGPVVASLIGVSTVLFSIARAAKNANEKLIEQSTIAEDMIDKYDRLDRKLKTRVEGTDEYNLALEEMQYLKRQITDSIPQLVEGWDEETNSLKINREEMNKMAEASKELRKTNLDLAKTLEESAKLMEAESGRIFEKIQAWEDEKDVLMELDEQREKLLKALDKYTEGSEEAIRVQEVLGETERLIADIAQTASLDRNAATDDIINKIREHQIALEEELVTLRKTEMEKTRATRDSAIARIKIIQEEINARGQAGKATFLGDIKGMVTGMFSPSSVVSTSGLKLDLEKQTEVFNQAEKDLIEMEKAIKDSERAIANIGAKIAGADGSGGGGAGGKGAGGGSKTDNWLTDFINNTLAAAVAENKLTGTMERAMAITDARQNLYKASAMTLQEYTQGIKIQTGAQAVLTRHQEQLHAEADAYRAAIVMLEEQQRQLNTTTTEGQEAYQKIGDEIEKARQKVDELGKSWLGDESTKRLVPTEMYQELSQWVDKLTDKGMINLEQQLELYQAVDATKLVYTEQLALLEKQVEIGKKLIEQAIDQQIAAIEAETEAFKKASDLKITKLQTEIDLMVKQNEVAKEQQAIQDATLKISQAQKALADAKAKLANVESEKNTRIWQNGRWEYIADPSAVRNAQKEVESAQDKLLSAKNSYYEKVLEMEQNQYRKELELQIEAEKQKQEEREKSGKAAIEKAKEDGQQMIEAMMEQGIAADSELKGILDTLNATMGGKLFEILMTVASYARQMRSEFASIAEAASDVGINMTGILPGYASGGPIPTNMAIQAHAGEYMLNAKDVSLLGGYSGVENLLASLRFPSVNAGSIRSNNSVSSISTDKSVKIDKVVVSHAVDVGGFLRNLKQYAG